jgi:hypothetical protein
MKSTNHFKNEEVDARGTLCSEVDLIKKTATHSLQLPTDYYRSGASLIKSDQQPVTMLVKAERLEPRNQYCLLSHFLVYEELEVPIRKRNP